MSEEYTKLVIYLRQVHIFAHLALTKPVKSTVSCTVSATCGLNGFCQSYMQNLMDLTGIFFSKFGNGALYGQNCISGVLRDGHRCIFSKYLNFRKFGLNGFCQRTAVFYPDLFGLNVIWYFRCLGFKTIWNFSSACSLT